MSNDAGEGSGMSGLLPFCKQNGHNRHSPYNHPEKLYVQLSWRKQRGMYSRSGAAS